MTAIVTALANQSGGCGKTTSTTSLAAVVADAFKAMPGRHRGLIIDADLQCDTSHIFGYTDPDELEGQANLNDVLAGDTSMKEAVVSTPFESIDLILGSGRTAAAEKNLGRETGGELRLRTALDEVLDDYDFVFIDSPASLGVLAVNIFAVADHVIACVKPGLKEIRALVKLEYTIDEVNQKINRLFRRHLSLTGVLIADIPSKWAGKIYQQSVEYAKQEYGDRVLPGVARDVRVVEAYANQTPLPVYDPTSRAAKDYREVAKAMVAKHMLPALTL